ncbi:PDR/VanB family oxidoreductase [Arthrobacter crystallopoietes]|uniref:PDR/VanB family oxidoreductase n=1 Tax=Crystallibacter crystallopoietes TaxID=37928 RepID=UPI003D1BC89A
MEENATLELRVESRQDEAEGVVGLWLTDAIGRDLPCWSPGAHIELDLGAGLLRQYSLCGPVGDRSRWRICVLREADGRGGSRRVCDELLAGDPVSVRGPRNNFELIPADRYVFIAGGIGITPLLPMIEQAEADGTPWTLTYGGRSLLSMADARRLRELYPDKVVLWPQDEKGLIDLPGILRSAGDKSLLYCCGPEPLLRALESARQAAGLAASRVRIERFAPKQIEEPIRDAAFEVEFAKSGITIDVGPGVSIMEAARSAGVPVLFSCAEGTCGTCETEIISGKACHRDSVLTQEEQDANESMMICVSRAAGPHLVLDL